jgi:arsenite methyltransferase
VSIEAKVSERYAGGAKEVEASLCCPVDYDAELLKILPQEIIDKDYGCGDPSRYVQPGDCVLDLGSGGGKICYMAAQLVGDKGSVIGIDMTDEMLALARKYKDEMAEKLGSDRVDFRKGYIQDLALDLTAFQEYLKQTGLDETADAVKIEAWKSKQKQEAPLVESESVDLVVSNCVLNLVAEQNRTQMINEIFRVLKPGGRVAISDIVSDEIVPQHMRDDPHLWSGCISGAFQEKAFLDAFIEAGFVAVAYDKWDQEPWQTIEDIEFRSVTITAIKPEKIPLMDKGQAVIYKGPFAEVRDDLDNVFPRGERIAVSDRTFRLLMSGPMSDTFIGISAADFPEGQKFCKAAGTLRPAQETKGGMHSGGNESSGCC